ncbi:hypothetical protein ADL00_33045 [Streptomyces sp. AS58]|uniref:hypothetical protein n=1 Tax=Streptomyces sp. AS58 TaxID=1519489 RepID=UPI0006ADF4F4|nr:hypothetical protein [Streptomyces sp. AS58]KOV53973.1 hypothetical protein ADL00_33045 [Streptomyces sp. AS58]
MTDVVDSDELLRRIRRGRAFAEQQRGAWRSRGAALAAEDPDAARDAAARGLAYEVVLKVLDEILTPGRHAELG